VPRSFEQLGDAYPRPAPWAYRAGQVFGRYALFPSLFNVDIRGVHHVPLEGACVVVANHLSNFDPFVLGAYVPRPISWVAKQEVYRSLPIAVLCHLWGVVAVRRDGLDTRPLRQLQRLLSDGGIVGMFPEGTRSRGNGLQAPLSGAAYLIAKSGAVITPVGLWGAETLNLSTRISHGRPRVNIRVGQSFKMEAGPGRVTGAVLEEIGETIMHRIAALLPMQLRGVYAASVTGTVDA